MKIKYYSVFSDRINNNYRVAVVSDVHGKNENVVLDPLVGARPDIIVVPGDIEGTGKRSEKIAYAERFVKRCAEIAPVFVSLGNHDSDITRELITSCGGVLLDDDHVLYNGIYIGGLTSGSLGVNHGRMSTTPEPDLVFARSFSEISGFKILLSHHPEYYAPYLKQLDIDLIVSGHAHGGQWRFFGRGVFAPGQGLFPKYTSGLYDSKLLVSAGAGDHVGIPRLFNPNDICICDIMRADKK